MRLFEHRRNLLRGVLISMMAWSGLASAQIREGHQPLRLVVPFPAGTTIDLLARELSTKLSPILGRPVVVDNRAGASGNIGTQHVVNSAPDGLTLLVTVHSSVTINPLIYQNLKFDPLKDLIPVANLITGGYLLVGRDGLPRQADALVAAGTSNPEAITYASYGFGSMAHVCMEQFQATTGARFRHVPYKGAFISDLLAGHVDLAFENIATAAQHVPQKKLHPIALSYKRLDKLLPGVPAVSERYPGFECYAWVGVLAPKGVPAAIRQQLNQEINKIVNTPSFEALAETSGASPAPMSVPEFAQFIRADAEKWRKVIPPLNIRLD